MSPKSEWLTRKKRIDAKLKSLSHPWDIIPYHDDLDTTSLHAVAVEEYPTESGPADYALFVNGQLLGFMDRTEWNPFVANPARDVLVRRKTRLTALTTSRTPRHTENPGKKEARVRKKSAEISNEDGVEALRREVLPSNSRSDWLSRIWGRWPGDEPTTY